LPMLNSLAAAINLSVVVSAIRYCKTIFCFVRCLDKQITWKKLN